MGLGSDANQGDSAGEMASLATVNLGSGKTAVSISAGEDHTCAILNDGTARCWGRNNQGQLGIQSTSGSLGNSASDMASLPSVMLGTNGNIQHTAIAISAGGRSTCAILSTGDLKCWGRNNIGQLGQGNTNNIGQAEHSMTNLNAISLVGARARTRVLSVEMMNHVG